MDAALLCLDAASLTGTLGASITLSSVQHDGSPSLPTEATPPGCHGTAACRHSLRCPFPIGLPVPLHCHSLVIVGQIIAGANCFASSIGAASACPAILDPRLPPVWLPNLAHAAAPPGLPIALGRNNDPAQVGVGCMIPLLLQVQSQLVDVWASQVLRLACKPSRWCAAVFRTGLLQQAGMLAWSATEACLCGLAHVGCLMEPPVQLWQPGY